MRYAPNARETKQDGWPLYHDSELLPLQHNVLLRHPSYWDKDQLYDLENDEIETTNRAHDPAYEKVMIDMKKKMKDRLMSFDAHPFGEFI